MRPCSMLCGFVTLALYLSSPALLAAASGPTKPNVIVILTDDQGAADAGCYGAKDLLTPNIDKLAREGVRFTQFYAAAPVCSPSRAALLTGRYPLRCGVLGNAASQRGAPGGLAASEVTLGEMFKAGGYTTAHIGKWHLGYTPGTMPNAQGFDFSFGHMGGCIDNWSHFFYWSGPNVHDLYRNGVEVHQDGHYFPDLLIEEAKQFMSENRARPFFLYLAINLPHYPYQPDSKWLERYGDLAHPRRLYAAFVSSMDQRIGALLQSVEKLGLRDRTIVVFQSDNGHSTEERAHWGGGSGGRYRGAKFSLFEGGIRLPAIISWPGELPRSVTRDQLAHSCDWMPTLAELCSVPLLNRDVDGKSLVPVLRSATAPSEHAVLHWQVGAGKNAQWAVRQGNWKLIGNAWDTSDGDKGKTRIPLFLANVEEDPGEQTNLVEREPLQAAALQRLHEEWVQANSSARAAE